MLLSFSSLLAASQSLAEIASPYECAVFLHLPKMLHAHRMLLPQFTEASPGSVRMRGDATPAEGPARML